jgi:hypothetical protein
MTTTTDFEIWLEENEPEGHAEIYALYQTVVTRNAWGAYVVTNVGDKTFVKGPSSTLLLANEKARKAFLSKVDALRDDRELDMEGWYHFRRNMANPKA